MPYQASWTISSIRKDHVRDQCDSGEPALDEFLRRYARQNQEKGLGRTYVATREGSPEVLGYFTIRSGSIVFEDLPSDEQRRLPQYPILMMRLPSWAQLRTTGVVSRLTISVPA